MRLLKRCPFCGSMAYLTTDKASFYEGVVKNGGACVVIECKNRTGCGTTMFCHYGSKDYETMVEKAVEQWNRRCEDAGEYIARK